MSIYHLSTIIHDFKNTSIKFCSIIFLEKKLTKSEIYLTQNQNKQIKQYNYCNINLLK